MAGNVIRQDVIQLDFDFDLSSLKKLNSTMDDLKKSVSGVGNDDGLDNLKKETDKTKTSMGGLSKETDKAKTAVTGLGKVDVSKLSDGLNKVDEKLTNVAKKAAGAAYTGLKKIAGISFKALAAGVGAVGTAMGVAVKNYSDYEQLVGGMSTLLGAREAKSVQEYAKLVGKSVSSVEKEYQSLIDNENLIATNANNAYKTAGMSANQYMETITSFSAALKNSLGGDSVEAAKLADVAIQDMGDNVNKMGTDMESVSIVYSGLARGIYTTLDNLKLGYAGTKDGAKELTRDAAKLDKSIKANDLSYANLVKAIHAVQVETGIYGTTQREAEKTIAGSLNAVKAAWQNLMPALIQGGDRFDQCVDNLVDSVKTFAGNIMPVVKKSLSGVGALIEKLLPIIEKELPSMITSLLPSLVKSATSLIKGLARALPPIIPPLLIDISKAIYEGFTGKEMGDDILNPLRFAITNGFYDIKDIVTGVISYCKQIISTLAPVLTKIGLLILKITNWLAQNITPVLKVVTGLVAAFFAYKAVLIAVKTVTTIVTAVQTVMGVVCGTASATAAAGTTAVGTAAAMSAPQILAFAAAILAAGVAILAICVGIALLVQSAIALANAGWGAVAALAGLVVIVVGFAAGMAYLAPMLTAGASGMLAFGASVLMVGAGFALLGAGALMAAQGLSIIATALPTLTLYGGSGAVAIAQLGVGLVVFAAGAVVAGTAALALSACLVPLVAEIAIIAVSTALFAVSMLLVAVSMAAITAMMSGFVSLLSELPTLLMALVPQITAFGLIMTPLVTIIAAVLVPFTAFTALVAVLTASFTVLAITSALVVVTFSLISVLLTGLIALLTTINVLLLLTSAMFGVVSNSSAVFATALIPLVASLTAAVIPLTAFTALITALAVSFTLLAATSVITTVAFAGITVILSFMTTLITALIGLITVLGGLFVVTSICSILLSASFVPLVVAFTALTIPTLVLAASMIPLTALFVVLAASALVFTASMTSLTVVIGLVNGLMGVLTATMTIMPILLLANTVLVAQLAAMFALLAGTTAVLAPLMLIFTAALIPLSVTMLALTVPTVAFTTTMAALMAILVILSPLAMLFAVAMMILSPCFELLSTSVPKFAESLSPLAGTFAKMVIPTGLLAAALVPLTAEFVALTASTVALLATTSGLVVTTTALSALFMAIAIVSLVLVASFAMLGEHAQTLATNLLPLTDSIREMSIPLTATATKFVVFASSLMVALSSALMMNLAFATMVKSLGLITVLLVALLSALRNIANTFKTASTAPDIFNVAIKNMVTSATTSTKMLVQVLRTFAVNSRSIITEISNNITNIVNKNIADVVKKVTDLPNKMSDGIKSSGKSLANALVEVWTNAVKASIAPVNKVIDGANWIMKQFGSDKRVASWQPYAKGTDGHKGGNALVNDGRGAELVQMPNGNTFIPRGRNVFLPNAPKGMKVLPAEQTARLMGKKSPTFRYADGTGDLDIWEYIDNPQGLVGKIRDGISYDDTSGLGTYIAKGMVTTVTGEMSAWVKKMFDEYGAMSIANYVASKGVEQWRSTVIRALQMEGQYSEANVKRTLFQMQTESGGNPRAINLWDSNAKKGIPSKGLMQVIDPTFRQYARAGFNKNIYDPLSNILASVRYAVARYGSLARAYQGHGYANGGIARKPSIFGEDGAEMAIPLSANKREQGVNLWMKTGEMLGMSTYTPENSSYPSSSKTNNTENNTYSPVFNLTINGNDGDDRTRYRKFKRWFDEAMEEMFTSMDNKSPKLREV